MGQFPALQVQTHTKPCLESRSMDTETAPGNDEPEASERGSFQRLVDKLQLVGAPLNILSFATLGLFIIGFFVVLYQASTVFIPLVGGVMLYFLLRPITKILRKAGIPDGLSAGLLLIILLGVFGLGVVKMSGPARTWAEDLPSYIREAEYKLRGVKQSVNVLNETTDAIENLAGEENQKEDRVAVQRNSITDRLFSHTRQFIGGSLIAFILAFFLLSSGDLFLRKVVCMLPHFHERRATVRIFRGIESSLSKYLLSVTLINIILGIAVGLTFYFMDMPNPILWGGVAAILNYVPYIGALVGVLVLLLVSIVTYDTIALALVPPLIYLVLTGLEGSLLRPVIVGKWLTLNPVAIFVALVLWGWMWGAIGTLLAIPMLVMLKIACDHIAWLRPFGTILSR